MTEETYTFDVKVVITDTSWDRCYEQMEQKFKLGGIKRWVSTDHNPGDTR